MAERAERNCRRVQAAHDGWPPRTRRQACIFADACVTVGQRGRRPKPKAPRSALEGVRVIARARCAVGGSAMLSGTIDPRGTEIEYYFEYGVTSEYGSSTTAQVNASSGSGEVEVNQSIATLSPSTTYHYRLVAVHDSSKQYGSDVTFTTMPLAPLAQAIGPAPLPASSPPTAASNSGLPTTSSAARRGLSFQVAQHGSSLLVLLGLDRRAARVEVDAAAPDAQLGAAKRRGRRVSIVLARAVRTTVEVGQLKLIMPLDAEGKRALRHRRRLTLTVTVTVTSSSGEQQQSSRTLALASTSFNAPRASTRKTRLIGRRR